MPPFHLQSQSGQMFHKDQQLRNVVWVADFIFTNCPGPCPRMTQHMRWLQDNTKGYANVRFVSFTVDPKRDTPETLAAYAKKFGADLTRWSFLTGPPEELQRLSKDVFKLGDIAPDFEHSTRFALVDQRGHIRGYYGTTTPTFRIKLLEDIKDLVND
ncbi:cysteine ABC transporter ATP-binding protein [Bryobacterales bacterium F-183]|nr:cysteine ABC transporter ATP-binding protein [Bryobacterales bacterium F-183]